MALEDSATDVESIGSLGGLRGQQDLALLTEPEIELEIPPPKKTGSILASESCYFPSPSWLDSDLSEDEWLTFVK